MSRVRKPGKWMNTNKWPSSVTGPSKLVRYKGPNADYTKASSLTDWLFLKYDMTYQAYRNKSKKRREELKAEYFADTDYSFNRYMRMHNMTWDKYRDLSWEEKEVFEQQYEEWEEKLRKENLCKNTQTN